MMILTAAADVIRLVTTSANALDVHTSFVDNQTATATPYTPGRQNTAIAAAATTTVLGSPSTGTQRQVKKLMACARGGANTVTVEFFDGTTAFRQLQVTLASGEALEYEDLCGWTIHDATGAIKTATVSAGRLIRAPQVLVSGTVYTPPAGCNAILVRLLAGGGGGGGCSTVAANAAVGGGGASGGYAEKYYSAPPAVGCTYAIGIAGTAGSNAGGAGGTGGDTTFTDGVTLVTTRGGLGGAGQAAGTTVASVLGGASGAQSNNGDLNGAGAPGSDGNRLSGTAIGVSGSGGESLYGGAGIGLAAAGAGNNATGKGSGGGGGAVVNGSAAVVGGTGSAGVIIVEEYT